jgi:hypothetical protein
MARMRCFAGAVVLGSVALLATACASSSSTPGASATAASSAPATSSGVSGSAPPVATPTGAASSGNAGGAPACTTSGLKVALGGSQGTAGSTIQEIDFTNTGSASCTLFGYPGVSLTGGSPSAQIGAAAARDSAITPVLVTLAPGGEASAAVEIAEAGNYSSATCDPTAADALLVYPPNQTAPISLPYSTTGCAATGVTILHVQAVQAGSGG